MSWFKKKTVVVSIKDELRKLYNSISESVSKEHDVIKNSRILGLRQQNKIDYEQELLKTENWKERIELKEKYEAILEEKIAALEKEIRSLEGRETDKRFGERYGKVFFCFECQMPSPGPTEHSNYDGDTWTGWLEPESLKKCKVCDKFFCNEHIYNNVCINCAGK